MKKIKIWKFSSFLTLGAVVVITPALTAVTCGGRNSEQQYFNINSGSLESLTELGKKQTSLTIPSKVTSIKANAFNGCSVLTDLIIPDSVNSIAPKVFDDCSALKNVTNNSTVLFDWWVTHHDYNGQSLNKMSEIDLGKIQNSNGQLFTAIESEAFKNCPSLLTITIPNTIKSVSKNAFDSSNTKIKYYVFDVDIQQVLFNDKIDPQQIIFTDSIFIVQGTTLIGLAESAKNIAMITLPSYGINITAIGPNVFNNRQHLSKVTILNTVISIDPNNFKNCSVDAQYYVYNKDNQQALIKCDVPIKQIILAEGNFVIQGNDTLIGLTEVGKKQTDIVIPNGIVTIGSNAFTDCPQLVNVTLPGSIKNIANGSFSGCSDKTNFTILSSDQETIKNLLLKSNPNIKPGQIHHTSTGYFVIQNGTLTGLTDLGKKQTTLTIPNEVTSIGKGVFQNCALTAITIPANVKSIGANAFNGCKALNNITISDGVTSIGTNAFLNCPTKAIYNISSDHLYQILMNSQSKINDNQLHNSYLILDESGTMVNSVTEAGKKLTNLFIPQNVIEIGITAFLDCQLEDVNLPPKLEIIWNNAFTSCKKLRNVTIPASIKEIYYDVFVDCPPQVSYYVPDERVKQLLKTSNGYINDNQIHVISKQSN